MAILLNLVKSNLHHMASLQSASSFTDFSFTDSSYLYSNQLTRQMTIVLFIFFYLQKQIIPVTTFVIETIRFYLSYHQKRWTTMVIYLHFHKSSNNFTPWQPTFWEP